MYASVVSRASNASSSADDAVPLQNNTTTSVRFYLYCYLYVYRVRLVHSKCAIHTHISNDL